MKKRPMTRNSLETISERRKKWFPVWNGIKHTANDCQILV